MATITLSNESLTTYESPTQTYSGTKRNCINRACDKCRKRKVKCDIADNETTCKKCKRAGIVCTFETSPRKKGPRSNVSELENRLKRIEQLLLTTMEKKIQKNIDQNRNSQVIPVEKTNNNDNVSIINNQSPISPHHPSTTVYYEKELDDIHLFKQHLISLGKLRLDESILGINDWIYKVASIDRHTSDELLKIYFAHVHPMFPVVDKSEFLRQYRQQVDRLPSPPLLCAMYGSATRFIECCKAIRNQDLTANRLNAPTSDIWFSQHMSYVKCSFDPSLPIIQSILITMHHYAGSEKKWSDAWLLNSVAIRMAQDMGLHRSLNNGEVPENEMEIRKRLWGLLYSVDRWFSAGTGRPLTAFDEDCDAAIPRDMIDMTEIMDDPSYKINFNNGENNTNIVLDQPRFPTIPTCPLTVVYNSKIPAFEAIVHIIKLSRILGQVIQSLYTPAAKKYCLTYGCTEILNLLEKSITEWRSNLPPYLQIINPGVQCELNNKDDQLFALKGLVNVCYYTVLILIHRPFIVKDSSLLVSQVSLSICSNAAIRCVDIAEKIHSQDPILVTWGFIMYPIFIASLIHVYNAKHPDSIVSDVAKANLFRALNLLKRFNQLSPVAEKIYTALYDLAKQYHYLPCCGHEERDICKYSVSTSTPSACDTVSDLESNALIDWLNSINPSLKTSTKSTDIFDSTGMHILFQARLMNHHSASNNEQIDSHVLPNILPDINRNHLVNEKISLPSLPKILNEPIFSQPYKDFILYESYNKREKDRFRENQANNKNINSNEPSASHLFSSVPLSKQKLYPGNVFWNVPSSMELSEWPCLSV
ncbi:unnamed protein product [Cunninghamella blakesleeana]